MTTTTGGVLSLPVAVIIEQAWFQHSGYANIPRSAVAQIVFPVALATIHFPDRPRTYAVRVKGAGQAHGKGIQIPRRAVVEDVGTHLPCTAKVELEPAPPGITDFLMKFKKATAVTLPGPDGSFFQRGAKVVLGKGGGRWIRVSADISRGMRLAGWDPVALVEVGDQSFPARLLAVGERDQEKGLYRLSLPADLGLREGTIDVTLRRATVCRPETPWAGANDVDLSFFVPEDAMAIAYGDDLVRFVRHARGAIDVRRFVRAEPFFSFIGLYLADGHKEGGVWGVAGTSLAMMQEARERIREILPSEARLEISGRRPPGMSFEEATNWFIAAFGRVDGIGYGPDSTKPAVVLSVNSSLLKEMTRRVIAWMEDNVDTIPPDLLRAFAFGYLDGDGSMTAATANDNLVTLGFHGRDKGNLDLVSRALDRAMSWDLGRWRISLGHGSCFAKHRAIDLDEGVRLLRAGVFPWSMGRARLLRAIVPGLRHDPIEFGDLLVEYEQLRDAVDNDTRLFYPGRLQPGEKCVPYPLAPAVEDDPLPRDVPNVAARWMSYEAFPPESLRLTAWRPPRHGVVEQGIVRRAFRNLRAGGFPYPTVSKEEVAHEMVRLAADENLRVWEGKTSKSPRASKIVQAYHPEAFAVPCGASMSPLEGWNTDHVLLAAIKECLRFEDRLDPAIVLRAISLGFGVQGVTFFAPAAALGTCRHFRPTYVVDFCAGWGSRMIGAIAAGVPRYVGIDPATVTMDQNRAMLGALREVLGPTDTEVGLETACGEDLMGSGRFSGCDLVFTSPPYFDTEHYSSEATQSYLRYPDLEWWYRDFLGACIRGAAKDLVSGGHLVLNVASWMKDRVAILAREAGFEGLPEWQLTIASRPYTRDRHGPSRYEPILVFKKP